MGDHRSDTEEPAGKNAGSIDRIMELSKLFSHLRKRDHAHSAAPTAVPPAEGPAVPRPTETPKPVEEADVTAAKAIELFGAIQEVMTDNEQIVRLPVRTVLKKLPEALRGPQWKTDGIPEQHLEVSKEGLLQKLQRGRVSYPASELVPFLPAGWVEASGDTPLDLDLAEVVLSLPAEMLQTDTDVPDEMLEVADMRDYFNPDELQKAAAAKPEPPPAPAAEQPPPAPPQPAVAPPPAPPAVPPTIVSTPAAAPTPAAGLPRTPAALPVKPRRAAPTLPPTAWDGIERQVDAGVAAIDLNTASIEELSTLPGFGHQRADLVVRQRETYGPFAGVYDLAAIPGIGRKLFMAATGLNPAPTKRKDRHEDLNRILGLSEGERPGLSRIMDAAATALPAAGVILTGLDGVRLAAGGAIADQHDHLAALVPQFFRRARRHLRRVSKNAGQAVLLPTATPPLLLLAGVSFNLIAIDPSSSDLAAVVSRAVRLTEEINWLLGRRAVVRQL